MKLKGVDSVIMVLIGLLIVIAVVIVALVIANGTREPYDQLTNPSIIDSILNVFQIGGTPP